ncbi:hypothetical protein FRC12_015488 [Ceratobasidium sp. 428]|nr:hypothetical protein FRC12_015488 [Ceratobasidium sp. 428]
MAGRNSANHVPTSELPARMPGLLADTILACSDSVAQGLNANLAPDISVYTHAPTQPLANPEGPASATNAPPRRTNPSGPDVPVTVAPASSPSTSKRVSFGLKLATVGGEKWKGPQARLDHAPKTPRMPQRTGVPSTRLDPVEATLRTEPVVPHAQPQADTIAQGGIKEAAASTSTEAPRMVINSAHGSNTPPATSTISTSSMHSNQSDVTKLIENGVSHSDKSATNKTKPTQTNRYSVALIEPRPEVPPARPATSVNDTPTRSAPRKENALSASTNGSSRDATSLRSATLLLTSPVTPLAPSHKAASSTARCAYSRSDIHLVANPNITRSPGPPLPVALGARQPGIPNEPNSKHKEKTTTSSNQPTQKSIASILKSAAVALTSQSSCAETTSEAASESHRLKFSLVPFARPGGPSSDNRMPLPQLNETSNASPSTSNSGHLITVPKALSAPPHPEVLSGASNKEQWDIDTEYMVAYMKWRYKQDPTLMPIDIIKEIGQDLPRRKLNAWRERFASHEANIFVHRVPELGKRFHNKVSSVDPKTTNKPQHSTQPRASDVNPRNLRTSYLNENMNEVDHRESPGEAERDSSSSDSDDELAEGVRIRKRTRSEKNPERKRPRYTE